jgi:hypothetical protein
MQTMKDNSDLVGSGGGIRTPDTRIMIILTLVDTV